MSLFKTKFSYHFQNVLLLIEVARVIDEMKRERWTTELKGIHSDLQAKDKELSILRTYYLHLINDKYTKF